MSFVCNEKTYGDSEISWIQSRFIRSVLCSKSIREISYTRKVLRLREWQKSETVFKVRYF